jgi:hypothetical protein
MDLEGFFSKFVAWLQWFFRPVIKWLLHQATRLTELQRHCYGEIIGAPRTCSVESSLSYSQSEPIQEACKKLDIVVSRNDCDDGKVKVAIDNLVKTVLETKKIKKQLNIQFVRCLQNCSKQIWCYRRLKHDLEILRSTPFDESHSEKLESLWNGLVDENKPYSRISKQWGDIGFQGNDPKTDFRGMGMLGLENLLFFVREYNKASKHILSHSQHPIYGYSMAIVSINLTHLALKLFNDGTAKAHMYNVTKDKIDENRPMKLDNFHHFYSYLFVEFDQFWLDQKPENVMEFNRIRDLFENNIRTLMADRSVCFKINLVVDTI